jgi:FkbM family methyltransferase
MTDSLLRNKQQALELVANKGFHPDLVIDVGAAGGTVGLCETWPDAHYVFVEPLKKYEGDLLKIASRFKSAEVIIAAVGKENGELHLAAHPTDPHTLSAPTTAPSDWIRFAVPMITVDEIIDRAKQKRQVNSSLIKIDVDGPEVDVLRGSEKSLNAGRDIYVIEAALLDTEIGRFGEIISFMGQHNYEVIDIIEPLMRPVDQVLWQVDLLFAPRASVIRADRRYR